MIRQVVGLTRKSILTGARGSAHTPALIRTKPILTSFVKPNTLNNGLRFYSEQNNTEDRSETVNAEENIETDQVLTDEATKLQELEAKFAAKDKEAAELKDLYIRSVADFRNLQEVTKRDVQRAKDFALQKFAKDLLESIDNFGHALGAIKPETIEEYKEVSDLYDGVKMTKEVFEKTLARHGLEKIEPLGEVFNPDMHEAVFELVQEDKEPGTVFHVQQIGYTLNSRVLRPAKVGLVKDPEA